MMSGSGTRRKRMQEDEQMEKREQKIAASAGCGVIGSSFALKFAMAGWKVYAWNRTEAASEKARACIRHSMERLVKYHVIDEDETEEILDRIVFTNSMKEAVEHVSFIQESLPETYEIKQEVLKEIERFCPEDTVIASSSSGLLISEIARFAEHPERMVGGHPYNPPHLIPLIEVTKGEKTSEKVVQRAVEVYRQIGNEPVVLKKETLGFICNRLQMALYREACSLVMRGVCTVEDMDRAMVFGPGIRWAVMGPSLLFELGGGDGGVAGLLRGLNDSFELWYRDMEDLKRLPEEWQDMAQQGVIEEMKHRSSAEGNTRETLEDFRDRMLIAILKLHGRLPEASNDRYSAGVQCMNSRKDLMK